MARLLLGAAIGATTMFFLGAALGLHADDVSADVSEAAAAAHVNPVDLAGAVNSTGVDPYTYLRGTGELPDVPRGTSANVSAARIRCIITHESENNPRAVNPRTGASGLGQFLRTTWLTTPQGRAGLSVFDPVANRAAVQYMLDAGRAREFDAVRFYGC